MIATAENPADQLAVQQLRSFCVVFEKQSYAAAASELGLAVPTVWEQVRTLEKRYQTVLFARRGRRIEGRPLKQFRDHYPHVCLRLLHDHDNAAEELIVSGEADLALTLESGPGLLGRAVCSERAYQIDYLALFPNRHPLASKAALRLADLASYPLIVGHTRTYGRQLLDQAFHHAELRERVQIVAETDTSAFTIACVRAGMGIGVVAGRTAGILSRDLVTRSLAPHLGQAWIAFLFKRGKHLTETVQTLMRLIREETTNTHRQ
jgi:DNA-binding transcriptional LysR family regulator